jgi:hypothetical protein
MTMTAERSRIVLLLGGAAFALLRGARSAAGAGLATHDVTVYKSPT